METLNLLCVILLLNIGGTTAQLRATTHPAAPNTNDFFPSLLTSLANLKVSEGQLDSVLDKMLERAKDQGFISPSAMEATKNLAPENRPPRPQQQRGGTRPQITVGSDGQEIVNPLVKLYEIMAKEPTAFLDPSFVSIPKFMTLIGPFLFARGYFSPEAPEYFTPAEPRPGAWRDPYPFVLPSTTPDNLTPPL